MMMVIVLQYTRVALFLSAIMVIIVTYCSGPVEGIIASIIIAVINTTRFIIVRIISLICPCSPKP